MYKQTTCLRQHLEKRCEMVGSRYFLLDNVLLTSYEKAWLFCEPIHGIYDCIKLASKMLGLFQRRGPPTITALKVKWKKLRARIAEYGRFQRYH